MVPYVKITAPQEEKHDADMSRLTAAMDYLGRSHAPSGLNCLRKETLKGLFANMRGARAAKRSESLSDRIESDSIWLYEKNVSLGTKNWMTGEMAGKQDTSG